jgi:filamentous hemagglutinin family protein
MQNKLNTKWRWLRLIFLLLSILFPLRTAFAAGGIATDGTVGPAQTLGGLKVDVDIEQNLGTTVGKNLFHSFSEFNVNSGQTVTFRENTPNALDNVISRVTGGSRSEINGTLSSTPKGHANLYLINPSGVMFGQNARIDVPGAFHASTADEVRFQDGAKFSASQPAGSTLTAATPASFGFLGTSSATNGLLKVDGAQLSVGTGKKLDMVGRNISVENGAKLTAPEGEVRLEAVGQGSTNIPLNQPSETAHGALALMKSSTIDASGEGGGKVIVRGRDLSMDQNAKILANTNGKKAGAGINVRLTGGMVMGDGSTISASTFGTQNAGNIHIKANNLLLDGRTTFNGQTSYKVTDILSNAYSGSTGKAGNVKVDVANRLALIRGGQISSTTFGTGDAGNVTVKAGQLSIDGQGDLKDIDGNPLQTAIFSQASQAFSGKSGNIDVTVRGDMDVKGGGTINASTFGTQNAGNIHIKANSLLLDGQTTLNRQTSYLLTDITSTTNLGKKLGDKAGNAGDITLDITNQLSLIRGGRVISSAFGTGNAGNVTVKAGQFSIDGQGGLKDIDGDPLQTAIFSQASQAFSGKGGNIDVTVRGDMDVKGGGTINARTNGTQNAGNITLDIANQLSLIRDGLIISNTFGSGDAGNIKVKAGQFLIDGQDALNPILTGIITSAFDARSGKGGDITVEAQGNMVMKGGSTIDASTAGTHNAGNIHITAKNLLLDGQTTLDGQKTYLPTRIASTTDSLGKTFSEKAGNGGTITLDIADQLSLIGGGKIQSSSFSSGDAGNVVVEAGQLLLDGQGVTTDNSGKTLLTGIIAQAENAQSGKGGDITVAVRGNMAMKGGSKIDARSFVNKIDARSFVTGNAGDIMVSADELSLEQNSRITTASFSGNGGNITIQKGRLMQLVNSGFQTSVSGQQGGDGGNITVSGEILIMETGLIQANTKAQGASGGRIDLNLSGLIPSGANVILGGDQPIDDWKPYEFGFNVIQAAAPNGISGHIQSTAPQLDLSGVLSNLGMPRFDTRVISQDYCSLGTGSSLIRQGKGGLPPRSRDSVMY